MEDKEKVVLGSARKYVKFHIECWQNILTPAEPQPQKIYFITFTKRDEVDVKKWKSRMVFELQRKFVKKFEAVVEHETTNIHVHAKIYSDSTIKKSREYKTYTRHFGFVDIQYVKKDNGILEYLKKEGKVTTRTDDLFSQDP